MSGPNAELINAKVLFRQGTIVCMISGPNAEIDKCKSFIYLTDVKLQREFGMNFKVCSKNRVQ